MKLIFGLLALFSAASLSNCAQDAHTIGQRKAFSRSFYSGFPNGSIVSFFFKPIKTAQVVFLNFYDECQVRADISNTIVAHIAVQATEITTNTHASIPPDASLAWQKQTKQALSSVTKELSNSGWRRIDVYKLDDDSMLVWVQGMFGGVHKFQLPVKDIKSVYLFQNVDIGSVFYEKYVPTPEFALLTEPTPYSFLHNFIETNTKMVKDTSINRPTPVNIVKLDSLPLKARLRIVAWFGSNPNITYQPKIQILPASWDSTKNVDNVFTFYQEAGENGRKSYVDLFNKWEGTMDACSDVTRPGSANRCAPVEIAADGSAGELEHIWIQRIAKDTIKIGNLFTGPDRRAPKSRFPGTTRVYKDSRLMDMDQPLAIHAFNGVTILHASIHVPKN